MTESNNPNNTLYFVPKADVEEYSWTGYSFNDTTYKAKLKGLLGELNLEGNVSCVLCIDANSNKYDELAKVEGWYTKKWDSKINPHYLTITSVDGSNSIEIGPCADEGLIKGIKEYMNLSEKGKHLALIQPSLVDLVKNLAGDLFDIQQI